MGIRASSYIYTEGNTKVARAALCIDRHIFTASYQVTNNNPLIRFLLSLWNFGTSILVAGSLQLFSSMGGWFACQFQRSCLLSAIESSVDSMLGLDSCLLGRIIPIFGFFIHFLRSALSILPCKAGGLTDWLNSRGVFSVWRYNIGIGIWEWEWESGFGCISFPYGALLLLCCFISRCKHICMDLGFGV